MIIDIEKQIEEDTKKVNSVINEELKKSIGYNPTVKTVFEILCNNVQSLVQVTYEVAAKAEEQTKQRAKELKRSIVKDTDIDTSEEGDFSNSTIYAFPKIIIESPGGGQDEKYVGSKDLNLTTNSFPEIKFIEDVTKGITKSSSELKTIRKQTSKLKKQGFDTDAWVPNNPIDVANNNPFLYINSIESKGTEEIKKQFYNTLLTRYAVCKNYSKMSETQLAGFGMFDALDAKKSIFSKTILDLLSTDLKPNGNIRGSDSIISIGKQNGYVVEQNNTPILNESESLPMLGNTEISGFRSNDVDYIFIEDNGGKIMSSTPKIWEDITKTAKYETIFDKVADSFESSNNKSSFKTYKNHLVFVNASYSVWGKTVNSKLQGKLKKGTEVFNIPESDITLIDGGQKPPENTPNNVTTSFKTDYINN